MNIIIGLNNIPGSFQGNVVALGNFDGVHRGHQKVIETARIIAEQTGKPISVMTFEPHPYGVLRPEIKRYRIAGFRDKIEFFQKFGVEKVIVIKFTKDFSHMTAKDFIQSILYEKFNISHAVTGYNFFFGHNREGDGNFLAQTAERLGFDYTQIPKLTIDNLAISSSNVRAQLLAGEIEEVNKILGYCYFIRGRIVQDDKLAINLKEHLVYPRYGAYRTNVFINDKKYAGMADIVATSSLGHQTEPSLEVNIFDCHEEIYGCQARIEFLKPLGVGFVA